MASNFPTSLDSFGTRPSGSSPRNSPSLAASVTNLMDTVTALEVKVGIDSSAVSTTQDYRISNNEVLIWMGGN